MNGEMKEEEAPESMSAGIGSALVFRMVISVCKSDDLFLKPIQIFSILKSIGGNSAVRGPLILFPNLPTPPRPLALLRPWLLLS